MNTLSKPKRFLKYFSLLLCSAAVVFITLVWNSPSTATSSRMARYEHMVEVGLVDGVRTADELGLEYLQHQPPVLTASLMDNIGAARGVVQNTANIGRKIPVPSPLNDVPVAAGEPSLTRLPNSTPAPTGRYEAEASVNRRTGAIEPLTNTDLDAMFAAEQRGNGNINRGATASLLSGDEGTLLAYADTYTISDASGTLAQTYPILTVDLYVYDTYDRKHYILPDINLNAFCRDSLNAVLTRTWKRA